jgi:predicted unusual protein kinase regulating ubiquinone biosynthesis (AarF/ABC1/UbiB family)
LSTASIAQVHRGRLRDGKRPVALKIKQPDVGSRIERDIDVIMTVCRLVSKCGFMTYVPLMETAQQVSATLRQQLDFMKEIESLRNFQAMFSDCAFIQFPQVYEHISNNDVIVMESRTRIPSMK